MHGRGGLEVKSGVSQKSITGENERLCPPTTISLSTKTSSRIHRESPTDYVSTNRIDILHSEAREAIGQVTVYRVRMDQIRKAANW